MLITHSLKVLYYDFFFQKCLGYSHVRITIHFNVVIKLSMELKSEHFYNIVNYSQGHAVDFCLSKSVKSLCKALLFTFIFHLFKNEVSLHFVKFIPRCFIFLVVIVNKCFHCILTEIVVERIGSVPVYFSGITFY